MILKDQIKRLLKNDKRLYKCITRVYGKVCNLNWKIKDNKKFRNDQILYNKLNKRKAFEIKKIHMFAIKSEYRDAAGTVGGYFWQDLWASLRIKSNGLVENHYDIGSRIDGFISHLVVLGYKITLIDIRPLDNKIPNVNFIEMDATNLENIENNSIESLSSLCALEHFGLGRYGDPIDPNACFKAFKSIERVMKKKGKIYISVPVGVERVEFNAHRIFNPFTIINSFPNMKLLEFSIIVSGKLEERIIYNYDLKKFQKKPLEGMGLFIFEKIGF